MPELPEVETVRRELEPSLVGRTFTTAWSHPSAKFTPAIEVVGTRVESLGRRGKYLLAATDDDTELVVHLGMTGQWLIGEEVDDPYVRAKWRLDDDRWLTFRDV
ncbi:MAG: DNA-formamidopyrimidine glycosylase family protein, partial [Acidimicrobiales bacterium]